jgi:hypothetical protein
MKPSRARVHQRWSGSLLYLRGKPDRRPGPRPRAQPGWRVLLGSAQGQPTRHENHDGEKPGPDESLA